MAPDQAGAQGATLHQLRHNVATFLVGSGQTLQAQARRGHADAATTLREHAYGLLLPTARPPIPSTTTSI